VLPREVERSRPLGRKGAGVQRNRVLLPPNIAPPGTEEEAASISLCALQDMNLSGPAATVIALDQVGQGSAGTKETGLCFLTR